MVSVTTCLALSLPAIPASIPKARVSVGDAAARLGASERVVADIRLCVSEAVSNAVRHAYEKTRGDVDVALERANGGLNVVVRDDGRGMKARPARRTNAGGYGLRIMESLADRLIITSERERGTEVRMTFPFVRASSV